MRTARLETSTFRRNDSVLNERRTGAHDRSGKRAVFQAERLLSPTDLKVVRFLRAFNSQRASAESLAAGKKALTELRRLGALGSAEARKRRWPGSFAARDLVEESNVTPLQKAKSAQDGGDVR